MFSRIPPVTRYLLIANLVVFVLQLVLGEALNALMLWPLGSADHGAPGFWPWQLVTYAFLHAPDNPLHLAFNMLALVMFGAQVEHVWKTKRYATYYFVSVVGAALCQLAVAWLTMSQGVPAYPVLGASGGIFGLLLAYGVLFPNQRVMLLFPPIPMKARTLVILYAAVELLLGLNGWQPGVAHFAHLGGMLFGWLLILYWRRPRPPRTPPRRRHLRSVN
ncbi:rhomboid family intramembrane serine protease [Agrilutibacter solisilvae]|uniref:Rhomboid family intramembrane serine protease n=1 Tax=Agrilutibacter solisilvae TaxID=2763317 RepID=A0A974Y6V8_9GAMM|nr:rhomboid family intramembrane serine protease [Lysobacter solisilvae]QSX80026.1 rhomboid family intramembrane serine protease [Lysobacter solisilvae]